jgi:hypothetical protein
MNRVMIDIWPYLLPVLLAGGAGLIGWVHNLRTRVAILEKMTENLQKRMDSHSKKQDEILDKMNSMERELLRQVGNINVSMGSLSSDVQGLSRLLTFCDTGYRINRDPSDIK